MRLIRNCRRGSCPGARALGWHALVVGPDGWPGCLAGRLARLSGGTAGTAVRRNGWPGCPALGLGSAFPSASPAWLARAASIHRRTQRLPSSPMLRPMLGQVVRPVVQWSGCRRCDDGFQIPHARGCRMQGGRAARRSGAAGTVPARWRRRRRAAASVLDALAADHDVIAPDHPGFGGVRDPRLAGRRRRSRPFLPGIHRNA